MKKKYGVCLGMLAMGLAVVGAPASRAAGEAGTTETSVAATPVAASSPADLDRRIEALESELTELKTALEVKKAEEAAAPAPVPAVAAQDAKPSDKVTVASLLGPTSVSGFIDTYYQVNFNHPNQAAPNFYQGAGFRSFDFRSQTMALNLAELILDKAPAADTTVGRIGYHVALGYGDAMDVYSGAAALNTTKQGVTQFLLKEAYGSYLAPVGKGLQIDFGKFVTPMGAEVVEAKDNWNYSRSILFGYAIPFYHFGVRAKYTLSDKYSITGFLVNGWNNTTDNNSGKTFGASFAATPTKQWTYYINYLTGPEETAGTFGLNNALTAPISVNNAWRQTWDATAMYTPTSQWSFMANFDYGRGDRTCISCNFGGPTGPIVLSSPASWWGIAAYAKYALTANDYLAGRYEYYADPDGFTTTGSIPGQFFGTAPGLIHNGSLGAFGVKNVHLNEFTVTYQHTFASYLLTRAEFRRDMADYPVFAVSNFNLGSKNQNTASISLILLFDSRNAK